MCGIAGFAPLCPGTGERNRQDMQAICRAMTDPLRHRGPDGSGIWTDERFGVAFGHRRLSILDLSPSGAQPMESACKRFVLTYNGEIYNHPDLRRELESLGHAFRGTSDTETLLAAIAEWGLEAALKRAIGMFALALWDRENHTLQLARDRMGIKPLFYARTRNSLLFASELKGLRPHPEFSPRLNRNALSLFFRHNYIPAPHCIYEGAHKLEPGHILTLDSNGTHDHCWWSAASAWEKGLAAPFSGSADEAAEHLHRLFSDAVRLRMISDVPLGAFLSGGIDSSTVAALMQAQSSNPVRTFSIGFDEPEYDESPMARAIAQHLGTDHTELRVTPREMAEVIPSLPEYWDEPFADSSQVPSLCLARLTRQHVTVALSGDGGDELFMGYARYALALRAWKLLGCLPLPVRRAISRTGKAVPNRVMGLLGPLASKIHWRLDALALPDFQTFYRHALSHQKHPEDFVLGATEPDTPFTHDYGKLTRHKGALMTLMDTRAYLPDDILTKVDRATMAASLEARVPLLDHRVVEFAASLPADMKLGPEGRAKLPLRAVLARHVPPALFERPKMGFSIPLEHWLRTDLRDWCESLLDPKIIRGQGYVDVDMVARMWRNYKNGQGNWSTYIWDTLMFQAWLDRHQKDLS